MQDRESLSINSGDTSISQSKQLEVAIPPSKISGLSSGEFVGMVTDNPDERIELKTFHCQIINDHQALKQEESVYKEIQTIRRLDSGMVQQKYLQIKQDIQDIIRFEMDRLSSNPAMKHRMIRKN